MNFSHNIPIFVWVRRLPDSPYPPNSKKPKEIGWYPYQGVSRALYMHSLSSLIDEEPCVGGDSNNLECE